MRLGDLDVLKEELKQYFSDGTLDSVSAKLAFNMIFMCPTRNCSECPCNHCHTETSFWNSEYKEKRVKT